MKTMKKLTIILDIDDVLMECCDPAAELVRAEYGYNIRFEDMTAWAFTNFPKEVGEAMFEVMGRDEFIRIQRPNPGAVELVHDLREMGHTVIIFSSVKPSKMSVRAEMIQEFFHVPDSDIVLGGHKNLMKADIILDDAPINIQDSCCTFPVLMRKPWNRDFACKYAVNNFEEFLEIVKYVAADEPVMLSDKPYIVLVGPSGSGKTAIAEMLAKDSSSNPSFSLVRSTTSRPKRRHENESEYDFVSQDEFEQMVAAGKMLEYTQYAGNYYGTTRDSVLAILKSGKIPISAMDIYGAKSVKKVLGGRAKLVFVYRSKKDVLKAILSRGMPVEATVQRILTLDEENKNRKWCDTILDNTTTLDSAVKQLRDYIFTEGY